MSDSLERASEMDAPLQQLKQKIDAEPAPRSGGSAIGGLSLLLVLLLACALGAGGYWLWPEFQQLQHDTAVTQQNLQRLTEQQQQQLDAASQLQQQIQTEQQQRLTQLEQRLQQQHGQGRQQQQGNDSTVQWLPRLKCHHCQYVTIVSMKQTLTMN